MSNLDSNQFKVNGKEGEKKVRKESKQESKKRNKRKNKKNIPHGIVLHVVLLEVRDGIVDLRCSAGAFGAWEHIFE